MVETRFQETASWGQGHAWGGFNGEFLLKPKGGKNAYATEFTFTSAFPIHHMWGCEIVSNHGNTYTIRIAEWNRPAANGFYAIGFTASGQLSQVSQTLATMTTATPAVSAPEAAPAPQPAPIPEAATPPAAQPPASQPPVAEQPAPVPAQPEAAPAPVPAPPVVEAQPQPVAPTPAPQPEPDYVDTPTMGSPSKPVYLDGTKPLDAAHTQGQYQDVLEKATNFYYAQYAGDLPNDFYFSWRGDSTLTDGRNVGRDLSGGLFDAGDHVKFALPLAHTGVLLAESYVEGKAGHAAAGSTDALLDHLRKINDFFLQAYDDRGTASIADDRFYAQVGDGHIDHAYWGSPESMKTPRPVGVLDAKNPGSEPTALAAASMASASVIFAAEGDQAYANRLIGQAKKLYAFAETYQGNYAQNLYNADTGQKMDVATFYNSWSGYADELTRGAAWLYKATGDKQYLDKAERYYWPASEQYAMSWDNQGHNNSLMLYQLTGNEKYGRDIEKLFDYWMHDITRTPDGLGWNSTWGSNRYAANTSYQALVYAQELQERGIKTDYATRLVGFATEQLDIIMGANSKNFSYVVGFGNNYAQQAHHRAASGVHDAGVNINNKHLLEGALVGGPSDANGFYEDKRTNFYTNEVATDYNAGLVGALAVLNTFMEDWDARESAGGKMSNAIPYDTSALDMMVVAPN